MTIGIPSAAHGVRREKQGMFEDCEPLDGFHAPERDDVGPFVWTEGSFRIRLRRSARFALAHLCYYGDEGTLLVAGREGSCDQLNLVRGWQFAPVRLGSTATGDELTWTIEPVVPVTGDARELGLMVRGIELFDDARRYHTISQTLRNLCSNHREYATGQIVLESVPPQVRLNFETRCNIPETSSACAYCAWDWAKQMEKGSPAFGIDTLAELGEFYTSASEINDCSIGEPTMHKDFGRIVEQLDRDGKPFSLTSNGQLLSAKRRRELLGKDVSLYVSIDSATAQGYARYRNDRFDTIIANLTALCRDKKAHGNRPRVYVSFIAMRSNVAELPAYFALMADVGIDEIKLRSLYLDENLPAVTINNGYRFDYARELLTAEQLADAARLARELSRQHGVGLYVECEQFPIAASSPDLATAPLCSEPWKTLYVLRRGIMPCCYATEPIATWEQQQGRPLATFLRDVFNGPQYQEIRSALAAGQLADYCLNTPSCPILTQQHSQGTLTAPVNAWQQQVLVNRGCAAPAALTLVSIECLTTPRDKAA